MSREVRINGWKAIGAYFGRDRTTAIRWANTRGLPVRKIPGGKHATVYALAHELDEWAASHQGSGEGDEPVDPPLLEEEPEAPLLDTEVVVPAPAADVVAPAAQGAAPRAGAGVRRRHWWLAALGLAMASIAIAWWWPRGASTPVAPVAQTATEQLPVDERARVAFLEARDQWALRTQPSLVTAVAKLEEVIGLEPDFAPAYAALADAYLLMREFGSLSDAVAFPKARQAVSRALELDDRLYSGHRALGFILYWFEKDVNRSVAAFERALALQPDDAQTHFWFANVLSDVGDHARAMAEFGRARLLNPGSSAIESDLAWAHWNEGDTATAKRLLQSLIQREPQFVGPHDVLGELLLSEGDVPGYLAAIDTIARLRGEPQMQSQVAALVAARRQGGDQAFWSALLTAAMVDQTRAPFPDHSWAAMVAHLAGDRAQLLSILRLARSQQQVWGASGRVHRIQQRWASDREIGPLLQALRARLTP